MSEASAAIYEASVYSRTVTYKNFKGEENTVVLYFALDPLQLLQVISGFATKTSKSGNPARRGVTEIDEGEQIRFVRDLCVKAAGTPSDDGEVWEPFPDFADSIAGKAFLTKLAASDTDRKEFAEKVILNPFRAFVNFASAEPTNTPAEVQQFQSMLKQLENVFTESTTDESLVDRKARLAAELAAMDNPGEGIQGPS